MNEKGGTTEPSSDQVVKKENIHTKSCLFTLNGFGVLKTVISCYKDRRRSKAQFLQGLFSFYFREEGVSNASLQSWFEIWIKTKLTC